MMTSKTAFNNKGTYKKKRICNVLFLKIHPLIFCFEKHYQVTIASHTEFEVPHEYLAFHPVHLQF